MDAALRPLYPRFKHSWKKKLRYVSVLKVRTPDFCVIFKLFDGLRLCLGGIAVY